jgi:hypothetical protein
MTQSDTSAVFNSSSHGLHLLACLTLSIAFVLPAPASTHRHNSAGRQPAELPGDANVFVRDVLENEVAAQKNDQSLWMYRLLDASSGKKKLYVVCQIRNGQIRRLIAINNQRLSQSQAKAEDMRVRKLAADPSQVRANAKKAHEDAMQGQHLLEMFPKAFRFQYDGEQEGLVRLKFAPDPVFHPTSHASEAFHHMEGTMLLDPHAMRLAEIHGELTSEVKFWGGLLGHLDPGGTFAITQKDVGSGYWELTSLHVNMDGKALFFKTIAVRQHEDYSDFQQVPTDITLEEAATRVETAPALIDEASD